MGVECSERARPTVGLGTLFSKGPERVVHVVSVAATQLRCCREKTVGWIGPRGHSFLIPDFLSKAVPPPPLNEDSGVFPGEFTGMGKKTWDCYSSKE